MTFIYDDLVGIINKYYQNLAESEGCCAELCNYAKNAIWKLVFPSKWAVYYSYKLNALDFVYKLDWS